MKINELARSDPKEKKEKSVPHPPTFKNPVTPPLRMGIHDVARDLPPPEIFDALFEKWADEALQAAGFPAEEPKQGNRIPTIVKRKVAQLCEMKVCLPDSQPACFRMADSKGGEGGPYNRFTYGRMMKRIYPNYEYLVQIAAFRDLMMEYGSAAAGSDQATYLILHQNILKKGYSGTLKRHF